jgi:hypothetical protein
MAAAAAAAAAAALAPVLAQRSERHTGRMRVLDFQEGSRSQKVNRQ